MTKSEILSKCTSFSVKNFIADLPRLLNDAFNAICDCIFSFYNNEDGDIHLENIGKIEAGYIDATTVITQNLRFKGANGVIYNYNDIATLISNLEKKIDNIKNITKEQIDSLDMQPFQPWPLYADYYLTKPENPDVLCKVLTEFGLSVWTENEDTNDYEWVDVAVLDGAMYLCGDDLHIYKRDLATSRWIDLGSYKNN